MKALAKLRKRLLTFSFCSLAPLQICYARITSPTRLRAALRYAICCSRLRIRQILGMLACAPLPLPWHADFRNRTGKMLRKSYRIGAFQITAEKFRFFGFCILTKQRSGVMILHVAAVAERLRQVWNNLERRLWRARLLRLMRFASAAACVVASALLELCGYVAPDKGAAYREAEEEYHP